MRVLGGRAAPGRRRRRLKWPTTNSRISLVAVTGDPQTAAPSSTTGLVIAIDGPSGSGKSSTARGVADRLGLAFLDTGSMYRALTVAYLRSGLDPADTAGVSGLAAHQLQVGTDPLAPSIALDGEDVTAEIRDQKVSSAVTVLSTNLPVRDRLTAQMREIIAAAAGGIVVEGRDITTVVCPQAQVRVLLVADPAHRMARRGAELKGQASTEALTHQVLQRDKDDATVSQFETPAPGVTLVDSTHLSLAEVIDAIAALCPTPTVPEQA